MVLFGSLRVKQNIETKNQETQKTRNNQWQVHKLAKCRLSLYPLEKSCSFLLSLTLWKKINVLPPYSIELVLGPGSRLSRVLSANAWGVMQIEVHFRNQIPANLLNSECNAWPANKAVCQAEHWKAVSPSSTLQWLWCVQSLLSQPVRNITAFQPWY